MLGDEVAMPSRLDLLDREMAALHRQMVALIPECIKLKPHLMRHIIGSIRKYGALWSCFAPERKHRLGKAVANTNFRNPYKSMLAHDIYDLRLTFQDPDIYAATALLKECRLDGLEDFFKHVINVQSVFGARKVRTPKGTFSVKDVLAFRDNGNMYLAKAELFMKLVTVSGDSAFLGIIDVWRRANGNIYAMGEGRPTFVNLEKVVLHAPYQILGHQQARVVLPTVWPN